MLKRKIIEISRVKCNGCGLCIPNCPEGAIQLIDRKATLVSDIFCDGLGACIGNCPLGAISTVEREAEAYDEAKVMEKIALMGTNVIIAHLKHLEEHSQGELLSQALEYLKNKGITVNWRKDDNKQCKFSCPGTSPVVLGRSGNVEHDNAAPEKEFSRLTNWPVQLQLVSPNATYFKGSDLILTADCAAYAAGNYHNAYLKGKTLAIACPKLDSNKQAYLDKLRRIIDESGINTLTVIRMAVPCCGALEELAKEAALTAERKVPLKSIVLSISGQKLSEKRL